MCARVAKWRGMPSSPGSLFPTRSAGSACWLLHGGSKNVRTRNKWKCNKPFFPNQRDGALLHHEKKRKGGISKNLLPSNLSGLLLLIGWWKIERNECFRFDRYGIHSPLLLQRLQNDLEVNSPAECFNGLNQSLKAGGASFIYFFSHSLMAPNPKQIMTGNVLAPTLIGSSAVMHI